MFIKRLLWQLYPSFLLIIIISVVGVAWYSSKSFRDFYLDQVTENLRSHSHLIEDQISVNLAEHDYESINRMCKKIGKVSSTRITVVLPNGEVIAESEPGLDVSRIGNLSDRPEIESALKTGSGKHERLSETLNKKMVYLAIAVKHEGQNVAVIRSSVSVVSIDEALQSIYENLFVAGTVIALVAALVSLAISKKISSPVEQMTAVAKHFASGKLDLRLSLPKAAELADLAEALNKMAQQLDARIDTITEERSQIQAILSSMIEGVLAVDSTGHIVSINKAAAELLGIKSYGTEGLSVEEVVRNPEFQQFIRNTLEDRIRPEEDVLIRNEAGKSLQLYGSVLTDNKGNRSGAVLVLHDITRTRRLEEIRRDFVANVSHELKTPVTSIKGFVETLLDGAAVDSEQTHRFLEIILKHSNRLNAIIEDLLTLSRLEEGSEERKLSFESTELKPTLESAIEFARPKADQKNIRIDMICDEEITANINSPLIEQAVLNFVDNAIKYSQDNSNIFVSAELCEKEVVIKVADQGCGIPKEHLERIFERFYVVDKGRSRKLGGTGLGLSIVKHIAHVHGGHLQVKSTVGKGSVFEIHLPANIDNKSSNNE